MDHIKTYMKEDPAEYDHLALMAAVLQILKLQMRIRNLAFKSALMDCTAPTNTTIIPGHRFGELMVPILFVCPTEPESYRQRPS
jgi:hypothetical protein